MTVQQKIAKVSVFTFNLRFGESQEPTCSILRFVTNRSPILTGVAGVDVSPLPRTSADDPDPEPVDPVADAVETAEPDPTADEEWRWEPRVALSRREDQAPKRDSSSRRKSIDRERRGSRRVNNLERTVSTSRESLHSSAKASRKLFIIKQGKDHELMVDGCYLVSNWRKFLFTQLWHIRNRPGHFKRSNWTGQHWTICFSFQPMHNLRDFPQLTFAAQTWLNTVDCKLTQTRFLTIVLGGQRHPYVPLIEHLSFAHPYVSI